MAAATLGVRGIRSAMRGRLRGFLHDRGQRGAPFHDGAVGAAGSLRVERPLALRSLLLVHRRALRHLLLGGPAVSQHLRDQIFPARPRIGAR